MIDFDGRQKMWACSGQAQIGGVFDVISYWSRASSNTAFALEAPSVLSHPQLEKEGRHRCDPSVIRGHWVINGLSFSYAMYYTVDSPSPGFATLDNAIHVAFSSNGVSWHAFTPPSGARGVINDGPSAAYGSGMPTAMSTNAGSGVAVAYVNVDSVGNVTYRLRLSHDGTNFGPPSPISMHGLKLNGVDGISLKNPAFSMAPANVGGQYFYYLTNVCETHDNATGQLPRAFGDAKAICIYRLGASNVSNGTWEVVASAAALKPIQVEPGFVTDPYGSLQQSGMAPPRVEVLFGCSGSGVPTTWEVCSATAN